MALPLQAVCATPAKNLNEYSEKITEIGGFYFGKIQTATSFTLSTDPNLLFVEVTNTDDNDPITVTYAGLLGTRDTTTVTWAYSASAEAVLTHGQTCVFVRAYSSTISWIRGPAA